MTGREHIKRIISFLVASMLVSPAVWSQQPGSWTHFRGSRLNGMIAIVVVLKNIDYPRADKTDIRSASRLVGAARSPFGPIVSSSGS